jgi:antitoxin VapB
MKIVTSRTFRNGNSEAVRLPKEFAFGEGTEVEITKVGDLVQIRRKGAWSGRDLVEALAKLPKPSKVQEREPIEFPERPGL